MRSTSRACEWRATIQTTKITPKKKTIMTGESPTAPSIATITITAIAFVVSFPAFVITPPLLLLPQAADDGSACLLCRKFAAEISRRLVRGDRGTYSFFNFDTQILETQVF